MFRTLLSLFLILTSSSLLAETVQQICELKTDIKVVRNFDDLKNQICDLPATSEPKVQELATDVSKIIDRITTSGSAEQDPFQDQELNSILRNLAEELQKTRRPNFTPVIKDPVATTLGNFFNKYKTLESRTKDLNTYQKDLFNVVRSTPTGKKVMSCFDKKVPGIGSSRVEFNPPSQYISEYGGYQAEFKLIKNSKTNVFDKVIIINPSTSPVGAINALAHELQHSCASEKMLPYFKELDNFETKRTELLRDLEKMSKDRYQMSFSDFMKTKPAQPENDFLAKLSELNQLVENFEKVYPDHNIFFSIDELKAYTVSFEYFKELAVYDPKFFCNTYSISNFFGKNVVNFGEYTSNVEAQMNNGTFYENLIMSYVKSSGYDPRFFFEHNPYTGQFYMDPNTQGPVLKAEIKAKVKEAGFKIQ